MARPSRKVSNLLQLVTRTRGTCIHYSTSSRITSFNLSLLVLCVCIIRHSDDMIEKLESAGLGFFIKGEETKQKLGKALQYLLEWSIKNYRIRKGPNAYFYVQVQPPCVIWCTVCWTFQPAWNHWCMTMEVFAQLQNKHTFTELWKITWVSKFTVLSKLHA